jgi:site-specific recombinase XerD
MSAAIVTTTPQRPTLTPVDHDDLAALAQASKSAATWRAYRSDLRHYSAWCERRDLEPLPSDPATVCLYLRDLAAEGYKPSTLQRRLTSLSQAHKAGGHPSPTSHPSVRTVLQGIRRTVGAEVRRVTPATTDVLRAMVETCGEDPAGVRDRALLLLGFATALRRSELVSLDVGDVTEVPEGLRVRLRRSKTDQAGEGRTLGVPYGSHLETCPVRAVQAWLALSGHEVGPLLLPVSRHGRIGSRRLSGSAVAEVVKRRAEAAGLEGTYSGHSLRAGFATSASAGGASDREVMRVTGHKSHRMLDVYVREGRLFHRNAAAACGL